jgi:hypothetical protein
MIYKVEQVLFFNQKMTTVLMLNFKFSENKKVEANICQKFLDFTFSKNIIIEGVPGGGGF